MREEYWAKNLALLPIGCSSIARRWRGWIETARVSTWRSVVNGIASTT